MEKTTIVLLSALVLLPDAHAAEIIGGKNCYLWEPCVYVNGDISPGDLSRIKSVFDSPTRRREFDPLGRELFYVVLNSRGGNLYEAMEIGRWIRRSKIHTGVGNVSGWGISECISSCVYILAAGSAKTYVYNLVGARVGIHRPYLAGIPKEGIQFAMRKALADSKTYFAEMNIPEQLADAMFSISPGNVEILTDDKLAFYRLNQNDIAFDEETDLKSAARHGMTRHQYIQNKALFDEELRKCSELKCVESAAKKYGFHRDIPSR